MAVTLGAVCAVSPQLIEVQAEYHRKSLALLQSVLPQIKAQQGECTRGSRQVVARRELGVQSPSARLAAWLCKQVEPSPRSVAQCSRVSPLSLSWGNVPIPWGHRAFPSPQPPRSGQGVTFVFFPLDPMH